MCGRFCLTGNLGWLIKLLGLVGLDNFSPRYNIAPGQPVLVFLHDPDSGCFRHDFQLWGLVPSFSRDPSAFKPMINARSETINSKPSFKKAFQYRRCILPASGFYEWEKSKEGKQPWYFCHRSREENFYLAGIWDIWHGPDGEQVNSCAIITTAANQLVGKIHARMPVILRPGEVLPWLDPTTGPAQLQEMLVPFSHEQMRSWKVDPKMNSPRFDSPQCLEPPEVWQPELF